MLKAFLGNQLFSAVLLAGGKSSRMGRDKVAVLVEGQPLWKRQLATLLELNPSEILISGRRDGPYAGEGAEILTDIHPGSGPLAGLETALLHIKTPWLVVLAVDLPEMNAAFLNRIVALAVQDDRSIVPYDGEWFEPLAAVYNAEMLDLVQECLRGEDHSMQHLVGKAVERDLAASYLLSAEELPLFRNLNEPGDLTQP